MIFNIDPLNDVLSRDDRPDLIHGVTVGLVTNNQDPDGLGRVKVKLPWLSNEDESAWARLATPMAGNARGIYFVPEVDDEVLVAFEHGHIGSPYVLGALWNGKDKPPEAGDEKNTKRTIKSLSGHIIRLDDTDGEGKIEIIDRTAKNSIVISTADNTITISADADIVIKAASGKVTISGQNGVEISSQIAVKVDSQGSVDLQATGQMNVKGSIVNLN